MYIKHMIKKKKRLDCILSKTLAACKHTQETNISFQGILPDLSIIASISSMTSK